MHTEPKARLAEGEDMPMSQRARISLVGPLGALFGGLLLFGLFVYGATPTQQEGPSQQAVNTQPAQSTARPQPAETTGSSR